MNLTIQQASKTDYQYLLELMTRTKHNLWQHNNFQWDKNYPNADILLKDILNNDTYIVMDDNKIIGFYVSNSICEDNVHNDISWSYTGDNWIILHRLCIEPIYQHQGYGQKILSIFEKIAKKNNFASIRIDVFSTNAEAIHIYEKFGYKKVGEAYCDRGLFYIYDKLI